MERRRVGVGLGGLAMGGVWLSMNLCLVERGSGVGVGQPPGNTTRILQQIMAQINAV